jgi:hypothetical protein
MASLNNIRGHKVARSDKPDTQLNKRQVSEHTIRRWLLARRPVHEDLCFWRMTLQRTVTNVLYAHQSLGDMVVDAGKEEEGEVQPVQRHKAGVRVSHKLPRILHEILTDIEPPAPCSPYMPEL